MMSFQNLFITKLPRKITDTDLERIFSEFHPTSAKVMLDPATGNSKGFGFVLFDSVEQGTVAYEALNHSHPVVRGHSFQLMILPSKHDGRAACVESNALYVRNIPVTTTKRQVEQFLGAFGTLSYTSMRQDHYGSPVWVVYAEYDCVECARHALHALHGNLGFFAHSPAPILAKFADCDEAKQDRRKRREDLSQTFSPPVENSCGNGQLTDSDRETGTPIKTYHNNPYGAPNDPMSGFLPSTLHVVRAYRRHQLSPKPEENF